MAKEIPISGFCPVQNTNYTILVEYFEKPNLKSKYVRGIIVCNHLKGTDQTCYKTCPLVKKAPDFL